MARLDTTVAVHDVPAEADRDWSEVEEAAGSEELGATPAEK